MVSNELESIVMEPRYVV